MTTTQPTPTKSDREAPVAPAWHTISFILIFPGLGIWQHFHFQTFRVNNRLALYGTSIGFELLCFGYVWLLGLRPHGTRLRDLIGGRWARVRDFASDIGAAFVFWLIVVGALLALRSGLGDNPEAIRAMKVLAPQTTAEMIVWVLVSVTAGFCEEVMFRGYLQRQLLAYTGSATAAVVLQGVLFGLGHLYQGWKGVVTISVYGMLFGALAIVRKSLRPGMLQHATQDSFTGIAVRMLTQHGYLKFPS